MIPEMLEGEALTACKTHEKLHREPNPQQKENDARPDNEGADRESLEHG